MDSYAWIEFFEGSEKGRKVLKLLSSADEIITLNLTLTEIARKYLREGADETTIRERLRFIEENSVIVCVDKELSTLGAKAYLELLAKAKSEGKAKPSLVDSLLLALSRMHNAKLVTSDEVFHGMDEAIFL